MHSDPKRDADKTEEAGLTGLHEEALSVANPSVQTPAQGPTLPKTPSKQDKLDLERSAGEGMTAPQSKP